MLESDIEKWLVKSLKSLGCVADKFVSPGNTGVPDRLIIIPGGRVMFVELKTDQGELSKIQKWQIRRYQTVGAEVRVVRGLKDANALVEEIKGCLSLETE